MNLRRLLTVWVVACAIAGFLFAACNGSNPGDVEQGDASDDSGDVLPDGEDVDGEDSDDGDSTSEDGDSIDDGDGDSTEPGQRRLLYRTCDSSVECPTPGTSCVGTEDNPLVFSHKLTDGGTLSITASELFGGGVVPVGKGICSSSCTGNIDCSGIDAIGEPAEPWTCQLVGLGDEPYTGLNTSVDLDAMAKGQPFTAICRPPSNIAVDDPESDLDDAALDLCQECTFGCEGTCVDPISGDPTSTDAGVCSHECQVDTDCAVGFVCASSGYCVPTTGTCSDCLNPDAAGEAELDATARYGTGKCGPGGAKTGFDCDQIDPNAYFERIDGQLRPPSGAVDDSEKSLYCSSSADSNCNGVADLEEMVGPSAEFAAVYKQRHCRSCNDVCDNSVIGGEPQGAHAAAECQCPGGGANCQSDEAECVVGCEVGYLDCEGTNDCESEASSVRTCGSCVNDCVAIASDPSMHVESTTCDESLVEGATVYGCGLSCEVGYADCDGNPDNGCEVELAVGVAQGDGTVIHCGACTDTATTGDDPTHCRSTGDDVVSFQCIDGGCQVEQCSAGYDDCDGGAINGCETDLTKPENCGACGVSCSDVDHVESGSCVTTGDTAECRIHTDGCEADFYDCDGEYSNGCETHVQDFTDPQKCGGCGNDCTDDIVEGSGTTASCTWNRFDDVVSDTQFCEFTCDNTSVYSCGGCGNDCTTLLDNENVGDVSCAFETGDTVPTNSGDLRHCAIVCDEGFSTGESDIDAVQCSSDDDNPFTCDIDISSNAHCGGCDNICETAPESGDPEAQSCQQVAGSYQCECVDAAETQICNGKRTICGEPIDAGCPESLGLGEATKTFESMASSVDMYGYIPENPSEPNAFSAESVEGTSLKHAVDSSSKYLYAIRPTFVQDESNRWVLAKLDTQFKYYQLEEEGAGEPHYEYSIVEGAVSTGDILAPSNFSHTAVQNAGGAVLQGDWITCPFNLNPEVQNGEEVLLPTGLSLQYSENDFFGPFADQLVGIGLRCNYFKISSNGPTVHDYSITVSSGEYTSSVVTAWTTDTNIAPPGDTYSDFLGASGASEDRQPIRRVSVNMPFFIDGTYEKENGDTIEDTLILDNGFPKKFSTSDERIQQPDPLFFTQFGVFVGMKITTSPLVILP